MMATKSCDDPVDLGPFLENYVLKNPFGQSIFGGSSSNNGNNGCTANVVKQPIQRPKHRNNATPPNVVDGSCTVLYRGLRRSSQTTASGSIVRRSTICNLLNTIEGRSLKIKKSRGGRINNGSSANDRKLTKAGSETGSSASPDGDQSDSQNGSGSQASPTDGQIDQIAWLRDNYRCLAGRYRILVSAQQVLLRIQQVFPALTSDDVDELILTTFPACVKSRKKNGQAFYRGLVARPELEVIENPRFASALQEIHARVLTPSMAAEKYGIRHSALLGAILWSESDPSAVNLLPNDCRISDSATELACNGRDMNELIQIDSQKTTSVMTRKRKRHAALIKDNDTGPEHVKKERAADNDDSIDFEQMLRDVQGSPDEEVDSSTNSQSVPVQDATEDRPLYDVETNIVKIEPSEELDDGLIDGDCLEKSDEKPLNFSQCHSDEERASFCANETSADGRSHRPILSALLSQPDELQQVNRHSSDVSQLRDELIDISQLRGQLKTVLNANLALQEELSVRDFHLAQLAEDFFRLHEQFKQLAQHFQVVLGDIHSSSNNSTANGVVHVRNNLS